MTLAEGTRVRIAAVAHARIRTAALCARERPPTERTGVVVSAPGLRGPRVVVRLDDGLFDPGGVWPVRVEHCEPLRAVEVA